MDPTLDRPSAGRFEGRVHRLGVRVYYEDTDFTGLVYHANYLRYFERGRSDFLRLAGVSHAGLLQRADPGAFVVTRLDLAFRQAARIDDALVVATTFDSVRGPRIRISQTITRGEAVIATAAVEAACIHPGGRARRPPPELLRALDPLLSPGDSR
jgi:acyl-CoA thioester hydrolase